VKLGGGIFGEQLAGTDRFYGLVVRVSGYRSRDPGSIPALLDFLRSSRSGTGPPSLVNTNEELLERKVATPV
jgi:hypothetical protein